MLKAFWFALKLGLLVAAAIWVSAREGVVLVHWADYNIEIDTGFAALVLLITAVCGLTLHRFYLFLLRIPAYQRRRREKKRLSKGLVAVTHGLTALATGDARNLTYQAHRASVLMGKEYQTLPLILRSHAALMNGHYFAAEDGFRALMADKKTAILGVRGLLMQAVARQDYALAETYLSQAQKKYPREIWLRIVMYRLQIRQQNWSGARKTLLYLARSKNDLMTTAQKEGEEVALLVAQADKDLLHDNTDAAVKSLRKALKINDHFVPAVMRLVPILIERGQRKAAVRMVKKAWKKQPHVSLAALWHRLAPPMKPTDTSKRLRWFETLITLQPDAEDAYLAAAQAAIEDRLWGEADKYIDKAEALRQSARVYRLKARRAEEAGHFKEVSKYLEQASQADADKTWICAETGRFYDRWMPVAYPHGSFNTIVWDYPNAPQRNNAGSRFQIDGTGYDLFGDLLGRLGNMRGDMQDTHADPQTSQHAVTQIAAR